VHQLNRSLGRYSMYASKFHICRNNVGFGPAVALHICRICEYVVFLSCYRSARICYIIMGSIFVVNDR
jgi:hypothetical protein